MKYKILSIVGLILVPVLFSVGGIYYGYDSGFKAGNTTGFEMGKVVSYEKGYVSGYDNGKEFVVTHLDQYVTVPKAVKYDEVVKFLEVDKTSNIEYSEGFNCISFANSIKYNAEKVGIKCGLVSFDISSYKDSIGHAINCFETTDRGIVYFDPQTDGQKYGIYVGGTYVLQGITYKITKVDVIW